MINGFSIGMTNPFRLCAVSDKGQSATTERIEASRTGIQVPSIATPKVIQTVVDLESDEQTTSQQQSGLCSVPFGPILGI